MQQLRKLWLSVLFTCLPAAHSTAAPAAELWAFWQPQTQTQSKNINHASWQQLLDRYLHGADDQINRFDYLAVTSNDRVLLADYLDTLTAVDPRSYAVDEQMAYWINLYNALTVQVVLNHPDKDSIRRMGRGWFRTGPWNDKLVVVADQPLTLNDIEHRILRPIWQDPRIHFAVNCASLGCPNLSATAFTARNLETMLAAAERNFLAHPRAVRFNDQGTLELSSLFNWYVGDFAENREQLLDYLANRSTIPAARLRSYTGPIRYKYDWSLNQSL